MLVIYLVISSSDQNFILIDSCVSIRQAFIPKTMKGKCYVESQTSETRSQTIYRHSICRALP
ncbi:hypothetical protein VAE122_3020114 [Vibrio aestuarianus]|nr:hypothetical protein VAE122_3020114 [Vibrio aestuarianus]